MQGNICAYCEMETPGLDTEHFRPKGAVEGDAEHGGYWWLAYECCNYFLACTFCNQRRKGTRFPLLSGAIRCTYELREGIATEGRVLLDPTEDPVEEWLTLGAHDVTAELVPNPALDPEQRDRIQEAIEVLGLNSSSLRSQRSVAYEEAARAAVSERWDDLRRRAMRHRPHSLAARTVLQRKAQRLPTADEERRDLLELLWKRLVWDVKRILAAKTTVRQFDRRQLQALAWAVVVLEQDRSVAAPATASRLEGLLQGEDPDIRDELLSLFGELR